MLTLLLTALLAAPPTYAWPHTTTTTTLSTIATPADHTRTNVDAGSFAAWLRGLPLKPAGTAVRLYDGRIKPNQAAHHAVVDIDVGARDLQQCADAAMRLYSEYRWSTGKRLKLHYTNGKPQRLRARASRRAFERWFKKIMIYSGTASLQHHDSVQVTVADIQAGDVLVQGGYPGHAVLVLDVATSAAGERIVLLGQSYMPAQDFHVLKNPRDRTLSPWYRASDLERSRGLKTPEWRAFHSGDLRRFRY